MGINASSFLIECRAQIQSSAFSPGIVLSGWVTVFTLAATGT